jgi:tetratricopeptide (TPR) repeat protein
LCFDGVVVNKKFPIIALALVLLVAQAGAAFAQLSSWDYKPREKSQRATSAGVTFLTKGAVDQAISSLYQANGADPGDPHPLMILGLALDQKGRHAEALDALHKSYKIDPKNAETVLSIGLTHYLLHNYDKAINAWKHVLQLNPQLCHIYGDVGMAYLRKGDFKKSTEAFRRVIGCFPNSQFAYHGLASVKYLTGDFKGAREMAEHAQSIQSYPPVILLLAKLDYLQGDKTRATKRVQEYNKLTRKSFVQRSMTAIGYPVQHDFRWDPYLADNFDNSYLLSARATNLPREAGKQRSLARQGKAPQVIQSIKSAQAGAADDYFLERELGSAYTANGQFSDAIESYKKVLNVCPDCSVDLLHLGRALALDGKAAEGSAAVREFQKKFPAERIAPTFVEVARVDPGLAAPPVINAPEPAAVVKDAGEAGF